MANKYWVANNPNSQVTDAQAQKIAADASAAIVSLTDSTGGAAADTIPASGGSWDNAEINVAVASLAAKINAILVALRAHGIIDE